MTPQIIFSISYVPFVILIAMACLYEGKISRILKILSAVFATIATVSYVFFIKNIL